MKPFLTSQKDEKKEDCFRNDSDDHMYEYAEQTLLTVNAKSEDDQLDFSCGSREYFRIIRFFFFVDCKINVIRVATCVKGTRGLLPNFGKDKQLDNFTHMLTK